MTLRQMIEKYVLDLVENRRWVQAANILNNPSVNVYRVGDVPGWIDLNLTRTTHTQEQIEAIRLSGVVRISLARAYGFQRVTAQLLQDAVREGRFNDDVQDVKSEIELVLKLGRANIAAIMRAIADRIEVEPS